MMLAKRIRNLRIGSKISQSTLANVLGVSQQAVAKWEASKAEPDSTTLMRLANYFNVSVDYLLGNEHRQMSSPRSNEDTNILRDIHSLTSEGRNILLNVLNSLKVTHAAVV